MLFSGKALTLILAVSSHKTPKRLGIPKFHMDVFGLSETCPANETTGLFSQACVTMHAEARARDARKMSADIRHYCSEFACQSCQRWSFSINFENCANQKINNLRRIRVERTNESPFLRPCRPLIRRYLSGRFRRKSHSLPIFQQFANWGSVCNYTK